MKTKTDLVLEILGVIEEQEESKQATMYHDRFLIPFRKRTENPITTTSQTHQASAALAGAPHHLDAGERHVRRRPHPIHGEALLRRRVGPAAQPP